MTEKSKHMANIPKPMSADEKRWQAESDAGTLKRYTEIQADSKRKQAAEKMIQDEIKNSQKALGQPVTKPVEKKEAVKKPVVKKESAKKPAAAKSNTKKK